MEIELNLSEKDEKALRLKAAEGALTVSELLSAFANDLVYGDRRNGSDECMYANAWYDRSCFTLMANHSFMSWLACRGELECAVDVWDEYQCLMEDYADPDVYEEEKLEIEGDIRRAEEEMQGWYRRFGGKGDWKAEMAEVAEKWR